MRLSSSIAEYVPALCTHRPSLLPIEWSGEQLLLQRSILIYIRSKTSCEPDHLEEGEVVTRFP